MICPTGRGKCDKFSSNVIPIGWELIDIDINTGLGIGIGIFYGYIFPYQRWLFLKSNKKEIEVFKSIIIGLLLTIVAAIPSMILYGLYSQ